MHVEGSNGTWGLSDGLRPGDSKKREMSDEVAFRVGFKAGSGTPPPQERYWRGPVLHDFDGHAWRRTESSPVDAPGLRLQGPAYRYTLSPEPSQHHWIFVLDWPSRRDAGRAHLTSEYI